MTVGRSWRWEAACLGFPLEWFYVDRGKRRLPIVAMTCASCPVQRQCLEAALDVERVNPRHAHGYRAGMTADQRCKLLLAESAA